MQVLVKMGRFGRRAFPVTDDKIAAMLSAGTARKQGKVYVEIPGAGDEQVYVTKVMVAEEPVKRRGKQKKSNDSELFDGE